MNPFANRLLRGIRRDKMRLEPQPGITASATIYLYLWALEGMLGLDLKLVPFDILLKTPLIGLAAFPLVYEWHAGSIKRWQPQHQEGSDLL